jgi:antitoxin (DNA-binding transcriptional repressor) of toxin-antitoxin stability system
VHHYIKSWTMKTVTPAQAKRQLSSEPSEVAQCESVPVAALGEPIAEIETAQGLRRGGASPAKRSLLKHLKTVQPSSARDWVREELYERAGAAPRS